MGALMSATNSMGQALTFEAHGTEYRVYLRRTPALFTILSVPPHDRKDEDFANIIEGVAIGEDGDLAFSNVSFAELDAIDYAIVCGAVIAFLARCANRSFGGGSRT